MHVESCLEHYMHMNYMKCLILDYVTLVNYVNICEDVYMTLFILVILVHLW